MCDIKKHIELRGQPFNTRGGGYGFFRKKIICSQNWQKKIVCSKECGGGGLFVDIRLQITTRFEKKLILRPTLPSTPISNYTATAVQLQRPLQTYPMDFIKGMLSSFVIVILIYNINVFVIYYSSKYKLRLMFTIINC